MEIGSEQRVHFVNKVIELLLEEFMVIHRRYTPYHPQENCQAKSTNKTLYTTLTKVVEGNHMDWEQKLHYVLWVYHTTYKMSIGNTPFDLVFGLNIILPIKFLIHTWRVAKKLEWNGHDFSSYIDELP